MCYIYIYNISIVKDQYVFCVEFGFLHIIIFQFNAQANAHQMGNKIHSMIVLGTRIHTVIYNTTHGRIQPLTFLPMRLSHLNLHILIKAW